MPLSTHSFVKYASRRPHYSNLVSSQPCPATTPISLCAASSPVFPSGDSAINAMANAPCAIPTCVQRLSCASATSVPSVTTRTSASCAVAKGSVMPFTASNARDWKKIGMDVLRSSTWEVQGRIYSTRKRIFGISDGRRRVCCQDGRRWPAVLSSSAGALRDCVTGA